MFIFGILLLCISAVFLTASAVLYVLYKIFENKPAMLGSVSATLQSAKHKKDIPIYERRMWGAPRRLMMVIKNWTKGRYEYTVNDKKYKLHFFDFVSGRQMPRIVQVIYLNKFPKIAYVKNDTNSHYFEIYSLAALMFATIAAVWGLSVLFR